MKRAVTILALCAAMAACSDPETARSVLADEGYTKVELTGSPWFGGCGKDDMYRDEFTATNLAGHRVNGIVCTGGGFGGKATTVRLYAR